MKLRGPAALFVLLGTLSVFVVIGIAVTRTWMAFAVVAAVAVPIVLGAWWRDWLDARRRARHDAEVVAALGAPRVFLVHELRVELPAARARVVASAMNQGTALAHRSAAALVPRRDRARARR